MNQKELNLFFMMISNLKNIWSPWFIQKYLSVVKFEHLHLGVLYLPVDLILYILICQRPQQTCPTGPLE